MQSYMYFLNLGEPTLVVNAAACMTIVLLSVTLGILWISFSPASMRRGWKKKT